MVNGRNIKARMKANSDHCDIMHSEKLSVLRQVYYDPSSPSCYAGLQPVFHQARKLLPSIKINDVKSFLQEQDVYTLHKPIRRKFPRNKTVASGIDSDWQADLCDV